MSHTCPNINQFPCTSTGTARPALAHTRAHIAYQQAGNAVKKHGGAAMGVRSHQPALLPASLTRPHFADGTRLATPLHSQCLIHAHSNIAWFSGFLPRFLTRRKLPRCLATGRAELLRGVQAAHTSLHALPGGRAHPGTHGTSASRP